MGTLATIIKTLSDECVARLASAGYPPLVDNEIVVGTAAEFEQTVPPRIIFDLTPGSDFVPAEYYSGSTVVHTDEREVQGAMRTVAGDNVNVLVHCWGASNTGKAVDDYDVTRALAHVLRAACQRKMPGAFALTAKAKYRTGANIVRLGRWLSMDLVIFTPVLDSLLPYDRDVSYAGDAVRPSGTDSMLIPTDGPTTGPSEAGC